MADRGRNIALGLIASLVALFLVVPGAGAEVFGQLEVWGAKGTGKGQFDNPAPCAVFGVDPVDGSVYAGDSAPGQPGFCRIQKFSASGAFQGSTTIQFESGGIVTHPLRGIAVDHSRERFYLIEDNSSLVGTEVVAFSTTPNGSQELVSAGSPLPLPTGTEAIKKPEGIAVDPANGDLVLIGLNSTGEHVVILRMSDTGSIKDRFDESGNPLHKIGRLAKSVVVGKNGTVYTVTGQENEPGKEATRGWELPENLSELKEIPGFKSSAEGEAWPRGLLNTSYKPAVSVGSQLAISQSGDILYFKENGGSVSTTIEPGEVVIRGYSLSEEKTKFIYGGGSYDEGRGACAIGTSGAPIGAVGSKVVVFDHANEPDESEETYGPPRVVTFGPNGTGCVPAAHFKVSPAGDATKGQLVSFDAEESDLAGNSLTAYEWDFGDGTTVTVEGEGGEPASPTISHRFLAAGEYTVKLSLKLANAAADPPAAEQKVTAVPASPTVFFDVEPTLNPAPGSMVEFVAHASDPAGGSCNQLTGCNPLFEMQSYEWDFGDGAKAGPSTSPTTTHTFENPGSSPIQRTVTLTVVTKEGEKGSTAEVVTVQGTADSGGGGEIPVSEPPPSSNPPVTTPTPPPPPTKTGPTVAEQRAKARKKCKKLKGKAKAKCMKRANAIGKKKSRSSG